MAERLIDHPRVVAARTTWRGLPPFVRIAVIYLLARVVTTLLMVAAAAASTASSRFGAHATIGDLAVGWDAAWYWFTALNGYPVHLPTNTAGLVTENSWAFMPLYAYLAQGLGTALGGWGAGAVAISLISGYLASIVLFTITRMRLDETSSMWAVAFFASGPLAALFQVGYAESLFLLWLFLALWAVLRRRYGWVYPLIILMAATRPGVLAFALFLGLHGIVRLVHRRAEPLRGRDVAHILSLGALGVVAGFAWQFIAGWVTGNPNAYLLTELSWRRNWIADASPHFAPFDGFAVAVPFWSTQWGWPAAVGFVVLALALVGIATLLLFEPHVRRMGVELRLWTASYLLYLLAVFFPQSSIFRLLVPVAPLAAGALAVARAWWWRVGVLLVCIALQWLWIYNVYGLANTFWRIP